MNKRGCNDLISEYNNILDESSQPVKPEDLIKKMNDIDLTKKKRQKTKKQEMTQDEFDELVKRAFTGMKNSTIVKESDDDEFDELMKRSFPEGIASHIIDQIKQKNLKDALKKEVIKQQKKQEQPEWKDSEFAYLNRLRFECENIINENDKLQQHQLRRSELVGELIGHLRYHHGDDEGIMQKIQQIEDHDAKTPNTMIKPQNESTKNFKGPLKGPHPGKDGLYVQYSDNSFHGPFRNSGELKQYHDKNFKGKDKGKIHVVIKGELKRGSDAFNNIVGVNEVDQVVEDALKSLKDYSEQELPGYHAYFDDEGNYVTCSCGDQSRHSMVSAHESIEDIEDPTSDAFEDHLKDSEKARQKYFKEIDKKIQQTTANAPPHHASTAVRGEA